MSLRLRLIQAITLVLLVTLVLGSILVYWHADSKIETEMRASMAVGARIARNAVDDADELTNPLRRLELLVADFNGDRHLRAALIGSNMSVLAESEFAAPEHPAPMWLRRLLAPSPRISMLRLPPRYSGFGRVVLRIDASNEIAEVWADAKLYLMLLGAFCAAVISVLYLVLGQVLKPLQDVLRGFREIGNGKHPGRIVVSGPLELAQLGQGFNEMADRLDTVSDRNARLHEQLEAVQEEERAELARNLHDEISPLLFSVDVDALNVLRLVESGENGSGANGTGTNGTGGTTSDQNGGKIASHANAIKAAVSLLKRNVKGILMQLRPAGLHALSLKSTIEDLTAFWKARDNGLAFSISVPEKSWGVKIDSAVQSLVRESLSNSMKHAKPRNIDIKIFESERDTLVVEVFDDGGGFSDSSDADGLGVIGMRERAQLLGGRLDVQERDSPRGVVVRARLPLSNNSAQVRELTPNTTPEEKGLP